MPKVDTKVTEIGQSSSSANFVSLCTTKSHKHMVKVLRMLSSNIDNEGVDELASFKEAMTGMIGLNGRWLWKENRTC